VEKYMVVEEGEKGDGEVQTEMVDAVAVTVKPEGVEEHQDVVTK